MECPSCLCAFRIPREHPQKLIWIGVGETSWSSGNDSRNSRISRVTSGRNDLGIHISTYIHIFVYHLTSICKPTSWLSLINRLEGKKSLTSQRSIRENTFNHLCPRRKKKTHPSKDGNVKSKQKMWTKYQSGTLGSRMGTSPFMVLWLDGRKNPRHGTHMHRGLWERKNRARFTTFGNGFRAHWAASGSALAWEALKPGSKPAEADDYDDNVNVLLFYYFRERT